MTGAFWSSDARLLRAQDYGRGWHGPKSGPAEVMRGSLAAARSTIAAERAIAIAS